MCYIPKMSRQTDHNKKNSKQYSHVKLQEVKDRPNLKTLNR